MGRARRVDLELIQANKLFCKVIVWTPAPPLPHPLVSAGTGGGGIKHSTKFQIFKNGGLFTKNLVTFKRKDGVNDEKL